MQGNLLTYLKLFLPILILVLFFLASEIFFIGFNPTVAVVCKTVLLIYYLRLDNFRTPLINVLTIIVLCMSISEYLIQFDAKMGQILFVVSNMALAVVYAIRQRLKDKKDIRMKLKMTAVFLFALINITSLGYSNLSIPVAIGWLLLIVVYFYDRVARILNSGNQAQIHPH